MSEKKLSELLSELRSEIGKLETGEDASQERLEDLIDRIQKQLDEPDEGEHHSLLESLDESIRYFEVTHPQLTRLLDHINRTLSSLGI